MVDKKILKRDERKMQHIYMVVEEEKKTREHLLDKFLDTLYQGSVENLVMQLASSRKISKEDLIRMRELLDQIDNKTTN